MHLATHVLAGWCLGNLLRLGKKERTWCIAASVLPDVDGLGLLAGVRAYQTYHHVLAHNLTLGLVATVGFARLARCSLKGAATFFALFHLHLVMDLFGSGPGWGIAYLWPWSDQMVYSAHAWSFLSWQNGVAFLGFAGWTVAIARACRRTPLECFAPRFDRQVVNLLARKADRPKGLTIGPIEADAEPRSSDKPATRNGGSKREAATAGGGGEFFK
ncbi:MAG: metal-dependent hydrolase [Verrucomicrobia bacterium]|nr:metal-dependent hydrolase [Verrucomicrobiota bacterium]